jgi:zinc-binding alcohol dehydrogenase family protein
MRAIGYASPGPVDRPDALIERDVPEPEAAGRDLIVRVEAVSVNPVDTKVRQHDTPAAGFHVLGYDAVGVVEAAGPEASLFRPGDRVWYAGSIIRPGTNAELHLVDERIVGPAPSSLSAADAAALPLTMLTAWEMLFERLDVHRPVPADNRTLLIIGGAGGVGSIAIQIAKRIAGMTVIATASRPQTADWCKAMGADYVVDHSKPLAGEVSALGIGAPGFVFSTTETDKHFDEIVELIAPQGRMGVISGVGNSNVGKLSGKSVTLCFELMFTRPIFSPPDIEEQHRILRETSRLVDQGVLKSTRHDHFGAITAQNLIAAHAHVESGRAIGKAVLEGFESRPKP